MRTTTPTTTSGIATQASRPAGAGSLGGVPPIAAAPEGAALPPREGAEAACHRLPRPPEGATSPSPLLRRRLASLRRPPDRASPLRAPRNPRPLDSLPLVPHSPLPRAPRGLSSRPPDPPKRRPPSLPLRAPHLNNRPTQAALLLARLFLVPSIDPLLPPQAVPRHLMQVVAVHDIRNPHPPLSRAPSNPLMSRVFCRRAIPLLSSPTWILWDKVPRVLFMWPKIQDRVNRSQSNKWSSPSR